MPQDTEDGQHATRRRPASGHVHGCHGTCAPGDEPTGRRLGRASLFAATERGFDFFESREIFLEPIHMLLHLDDG